MEELGARLLDQLNEALAPSRVDVSPVTREAYARDLSALGHLGFAFGPDGGFPPPQAVVRPVSVGEVQAVVRACQTAGVPVIPWGAGSGVCGGTIAVRGGVALDLKGLDQIVNLDTTSQLVTVEPGMNLQLLEDTLQRAGLTLGHHPSSITCSTIGGAVAARGAGQLSTRYGKIEDMVVSLQVVLPDGTLVSTPRVPRAATGPDWNQLFVGSEGVLGVIVRSTLRLHRLPDLRLFRSYVFPTVTSALQAIQETLQRGARPAAVRLYDPLDTLMVARAGDGPPLPALGTESQSKGTGLGALWPLSRFSLSGLSDLLGQVVPEAARLGKKALLSQPEIANTLVGKLPGSSLLIMTFEGDPAIARAEAGVAAAACAEHQGEDRGPEAAERWWRNRVAVSFKQSDVYAMGGFVDTMEVAVTWDRLEELHDRVRAALSKHALVMAHFSHAYLEGCSIYFTFVAMREAQEATEARYKAAWKAGLEAAVASGACVSHHHGVGLLKGEALRNSHGPLHDLLQTVKTALDPQNLLNPGKLGLP
jgi:alkyldihydroxyacetonephosphate synthase